MWEGPVGTGSVGQYSGNIRIRSSDPQVAFPEARHSSGTGPCVDCRRMPWVPGQRKPEKPGYKTKGVAVQLNVVQSHVVLTPG